MNPVDMMFRLTYTKMYIEQGGLRMERIPITEARNRFMKLPDQAAKDKVLAVTRRNKEVMAVMSWELYEGLLETLEILSDPELMHNLRKGIEDVRAGRTHSLMEASEKLGL
jgi:prevent-host-death family protein